MRQGIVRKGKFDAGHRVMHERFKCFNIHGHEYHYELVFSFENILDLGYAIDFKEIKRVGCEWIDQTFDHGFIANPKDQVMINASQALKSKLYIMNLTDPSGFCNPSAENIAKEIFFGIDFLLSDSNLRLDQVVLQETVNCRVSCEGLSHDESDQLRASPLFSQVMSFKLKQGIIEYDERKTNGSAPY